MWQTVKTTNVSQLHHDFGSVLEWIADGQQVEIVKHGKQHEQPKLQKS